MFIWTVLSLVILIAIGTCGWAAFEYNPQAKPKRPALWSPLKLALVEHETGVHPIRRACAEEGCQQCRLVVDANQSLPLGDGQRFYPANSSQAALDSVRLNFKTQNEQRGASGIMVLPEGATYIPKATVNDYQGDVMQECLYP